jgi:hypothetical protein
LSRRLKGSECEALSREAPRTLFVEGLLKPRIARREPH